MPAETAIVVTAMATVVYGLATLLLVIQIWRDRVQRERHYSDEVANRKLAELRSAFYEAWGYWEGHRYARPESRGDAATSGRLFEALVRLECQLRLNDFTSQANNLGVTIRTDIDGIIMPLAEAGVALGLLPEAYRYPASKKKAE
jgi:hypothetical protein